LLDTVDFNKACLELNGKRLPPSGTRVRYHLCLNCGFCFAPEIQAWSREQFAASIYNDDYRSVDPGYVSDRPLTNARAVDEMFGGSRQHLRHLDYGGGSGLLSATLRAQGWDSASYDPFVDVATNVRDLGTYDLVTAFEVFEPVPAGWPDHVQHGRLGPPACPGAQTDLVVCVAAQWPHQPVLHVAPG
jgi:hypothetical protein